ncbi:hypothetical protein [Cryptosporangium phraense]|uniref:DUF1273 family protein n=1 Tax=Cryptosporangium phraense TaxID=2593070 RepID=A0A545AV47_9ACTN|nr:hypothetical protein [Cryptosporangium phraense]TQS45209.1 hypothetical protein FL583_08890 [Cryptosporangium phraense]
MTIVGFTGHQSLSAPTVGLVVSALRAELAEVGEPLVGICSLAVGADQLFAREVLRCRGSLRVVVPSAGYRTTFADDDRPEYDRLLARAQQHRVLAYPTPSEEAYLAAGHAIVDSSDVLLAVWDGAPAAGLGGTGDIVAYARARGIETRVVWPVGAGRV